MNIQETYKEYAKSYDRLSQVAEFYQELKNAHIKSILSNTKIGSRILDFGAGTGNVTIELLKSKRNVCAIDISDDMIQLLKEKCNKEEGLEIINGDILELSGPSQQSYEAVTMMNVLYHLKNPNSYLKKLYSLIKNDGVIIVSGPHKQINTDRLFEEIKKDLIKKELFEKYKKDFDICFKINKKNLVPNAKLYDEKELKKLFFKIGFQECLEYSDKFYGGHNFFAVFKK